MKKSLCTKFGASLTLALALAAYAQPANDNCADALVMVDGDNGFDNTGATQDTTISCAFGGVANSGLDVWYKYTATSNVARNFEVTSYVTGDTTLAIYDACGGTELVCDDDSGLGFLSKISSFPVTNGTTYFIRLSGWGSPGGEGAGVLNIAVPPPPSGNDTCALATAVTAPSSTPFNIAGSENTDITPTCGFGGQFDIWYSYTHAGATADVVVDTFGSGLDTILTGWDACGGTQVACNDDTGGLQSQISFSGVTAGTTLYFAVSGYNGAIGAGTLNVNAITPTPFDSCSLAIAVAGQPVTQTYDTTGFFTNQTDCIGTADGFYAWTPSASGVGVVTTCGLTGSDTTLAAYDSCGGILLDCNDDTCNLQSQITFPVTAGNTYIVRIAGYAGAVNGDISFDVPPPPANDNCAGRTAAVVGSNPWNNLAATTEGPSGTCNFGGNPDGLDVWFDYTAGTESFISIDTFGSNVFDTTMQIFDVCGGSELACNDDAGPGLQSQICNFPVTTGTHYVIRVASWGAAPVGGDGVLNITASSGPTPFTPPLDAIDEPGTCDDATTADLNGGCNVSPNAYTSLQLCDTFKGTAAANLPSSPGFRDTDWYEFTLDAGDTVTVTGQTQFSAFAAIFSIVACNTPPAVPSEVILHATAFPDTGCSGIADFALSATLPAGTYIVFMAPQFNAGNTCGTNDQYWFTLEGSTPCVDGPVCNDIDFNNDGSFFDPQDIDAFLSVYSEGPCIPASQTCDDIDFNNDTSIFDPCDIDSFLLVYSEGPCTPCGV